MKIPVLIQKNILLVIVLGVTLLCAVFLIFQCLGVYDEVQTAMSQIEQDDFAVQKINAKRNPNPVKESAKIITANTNELLNHIHELRRKIGNPYREQLLNFLANLEAVAFLRTAKPAALENSTAVPAAAQAAPAAPAPVVNSASAENAEEPLKISITEDEIIAKFATVYSDYYADRKNAQTSKDNDVLVEEHNEIFARFRDSMTRPAETMTFETEAAETAYRNGLRLTFDKAFLRFQENVQRQTIEQIDLQDAKAIFMESLGLPRTMTSQQCKNFVDEIMTQIGKNPSLIPGLEQTIGKGEKKSFSERISQMTYSHGGSLPHPQNVVPILRHYQIMEDVYRRMREAHIQMCVNVTSPLSPSPSGDLFGDSIPEMGSDYKKFIYQVVITSTLPEIADFMNRLHEAFRQNRIYDIDKISLYKTLDETKDANAKVAAILKIPTDGASASREVPGPQGPQFLPPDSVKKNNPAATEKERLNDIFSDPQYGAVLLGDNDFVTAEINFSYIVYVGETLRKSNDWNR